MIKKFDHKSFFNTFLNFSRYWVYISNNYCVSQLIIKLGTDDKIPSKCDVIDGSVIYGLRQPMLFSLVLNKPQGLKVICQHEAKLYQNNE